MKTFNELVKGDKIYRLQYQTYMDYNNSIIPYVEAVEEFTIASSNNEIIGKEKLTVPFLCVLPQKTNGCTQKTLQPFLFENQKQC